jgi:hypothetical protein
MAQLTNINYMMQYVKDFLDGKTSRLEFDLDFSYELMNRWNKMCREYREYAEVFNEWIAENGVDAGHNLSDDKYKKLIQHQYNEVKDIADSGFF